MSVRTFPTILNAKKTKNTMKMAVTIKLTDEQSSESSDESRSATIATDSRS